ELSDDHSKPDSSSVLVFALAESTENSNPKSGGKWVEDNENEEDSENENVEENTEEEVDGESQAEEEEDSKEEEKKPAAPLDFTIILTDSSGQKISFLLSEFSHLQRQIKSRVLKIDFLDDKDHSENIFQTFFFDFDEVSSKNPEFDLSSLREIRFDFNQNESGVLILDQVGFSKKINLVKLD
ncbi:hypothetical protein, partial [Algoriphagus sp.]|uniref:hypothetical protein n=1 Tax=Algoriphagus sp. TaxID=1872435 RepID=UPI0025D4310E